MKFLIYLLPLISFNVFASSFECISFDKNYKIQADYNSENGYISHMTYSYKGEAPFIEFHNLTTDFGRLFVPFTRKKYWELDVKFNQAFRYLTIERVELKGGKFDPKAKGRFIVNNNLFSPEYELDCIFQD